MAGPSGKPGVKKTEPGRVYERLTRMVPAPHRVLLEKKPRAPTPKEIPPSPKTKGPTGPPQKRK